jgi:lycopene beta-cyclase
MLKANLSSLPRSLTPTQTALITLWVLTMISLPIVDWNFGWEVMLGAINLGVLVQAGAVIAVVVRAWGAPKTLQMAAVVAVLSWVAEALGSYTGFPFGPYQYTNALQPQLFHVPLLIPLAWLMMLPPSWAVAQALTSRIDSRWQTPAFIALSALAMTAWDFLLDPQMVTWGLWEWAVPSGFFGIPWINFLGWFMVSALITVVVRPLDLPTAPLLLIYTITWLLEMVGLAIFWGMPGPALAGGFFMGFFAILGWHTYLRRY